MRGTREAMVMEPPWGHLDDAKIGEGEAHGDADGGVGDGFGIEALFIAPPREEGRGEHGDDGDGCRNVEGDGFDFVVGGAVHTGGFARLIVDAHADEGSDERPRDEHARDRIRHGAAFEKEQHRAHGDRSDEGDEGRKQGEGDAVLEEGEGEQRDAKRRTHRRRRR